nr:GNAT family N-acetyltransferase [Luteimonas sp. BDR2-5]
MVEIGRWSQDSQSSLQVRRLSEHDASAYYALRGRLVEGGVHAVEPQVRGEVEAGADGIATRLAEYLAHGTYVWGAFDGNVLVGAAALSREYHVSYGGIGVLWGVYVLPRYRGTPASRLLMDAVVGLCAMDSTTSQILAACAVGNDAGRRFLQRFGFEPMTLLIRGGSIHGQGGTFDFLRRPVS